MAAKVALVALVVAASSAAAQAPQDGRALLDRMRTAYVGKWFKTVTFTQRTIQTRNGITDTTTWYEALKAPDRLRIDIGNPKNGNGVVYTADSLYVVRAGQVTRTVAVGNQFLPFVMGVYVQPLDTTLRQIQPYNFDLTSLYSTSWHGRPTYVAGAQSAADTTSPQFWIDQERLVVVRMILAMSPNAPTEVTDIRLDDYRPVAGGWLAVSVAIVRDGQVIQKEDYADWRGNVDLSPDFFVAETWSAVPHWHRSTP